MINPLQDINKNDMPKLGMTLFTSAYLHVNYDTGLFSIWEAKPTAAQKLVGIGKSTVGCQVSSSPKSPTPTSSPGRPPALSIGTLVGIIVGGIVGLAIVGFATLYLFRRRKHRGTQDLRQPSAGPKDGARIFFKPELPDENAVYPGLPIHRGDSIAPARALQEMPG
jgi:hypothetical protein